MAANHKMTLMLNIITMMNRVSSGVLGSHWGINGLSLECYMVGIGVVIGVGIGVVIGVVAGGL